MQARHERMRVRQEIRRWRGAVLHGSTELAWRLTKRLGEGAGEIERIWEATPSRYILNIPVGASEHGNGELELHQATNTHG